MPARLGQPHAFQLLRTSIPGAGCLRPRRQSLRSDNPACQHFPGQGQGSLDPAIRIWFAQGSIALRQGQPEQGSRPFLQQGLKFDGRNAGAYFDLGQTPTCC